MVDRKLGRGLDFFLSEGRVPIPAPSANPAAMRAGVAPIAAGKPVPVTLPASLTQAPAGPEMLQVPVGDLVPNPRQPRSVLEPETLKELADSIRESGVLQPILARRVGDKFEIVAGERRWRAAQAANLKDVPVVVRAITDQESGVFALVENLQRTDLNAIEKAKAFRQLLDLLKTNQEELGKRVGLDRSSVANFIRLLDLPSEVQEHVSRGTLSMGHARALLAIKNSAIQVRIADEAIRRGLSVRSLEDRLRQESHVPAQGKVPAAAARAEKKAAWIKEIEENLSEALGTSATVRYGRKSSVIQITCAGREEFERIFNKLKNC